MMRYLLFDAQSLTYRAVVVDKIAMAQPEHLLYCRVASDGLGSTAFYPEHTYYSGRWLKTFREQFGWNVEFICPKNSSVRSCFRFDPETTMLLALLG